MILIQLCLDGLKTVVYDRVLKVQFQTILQGNMSRLQGNMSRLHGKSKKAECKEVTKSVHYSQTLQPLFALVQTFVLATVQRLAGRQNSRRLMIIGGTKGCFVIGSVGFRNS